MTITPLARSMAAVALLAALAAGGCSTSNVESNDAAGLRAAASSTYRAILSGNSDAVYRRLTDSCRDRSSREGFERQWQTYEREFALALEEEGLAPGDIRVIDVESRDVGGDTGEARVKVIVGEEEDWADWQDWVYEGDRWRVDACDLDF
jgi:hypothetical protein